VDQNNFPQSVRPLLQMFKVDFRPHRPPRVGAWLLACVSAIVTSLIADAVLVKLGEALYPATKGYQHFQFSDYAKLTIIGVVIACVGWQVVVRITSQPTWLFLRAAILVTLVLLLPDLYIWWQGQPTNAVFVLVWMHLGIAIATYLSLVLLSPVQRARRQG